LEDERIETGIRLLPAPKAVSFDVADDHPNELEIAGTRWDEDGYMLSDEFVSAQAVEAACSRFYIENITVEILGEDRVRRILEDCVDQCFTFFEFIPAAGGWHGGKRS
jgi:hypothetical protein